MGVVATFTEEQTARLTGISVRQLRHWDRIGFVQPTFADSDRSLPYSRLYSFHDLVSLRVLNALRNEGRVPLHHLRQVKEELAGFGPPMWTKTSLVAFRRRVTVVDATSGRAHDALTGQGVFLIALRDVVADLDQAVRDAAERPRDQVGRLERRRRHLGNQLAVAGTRIPVRAIQSFAEAGYSVRQIRAEYPGLEPADIVAAMRAATVA